MALLAGDRRPAGRVRELLGLLAPSPGRLEFAARQALICALTTFLIQFYQTPEPALTVYVVFFLNRPDRVTSVVMNIVMLLLISIIIGLVVLTAMLVIDQPMRRVAAIATLSFGLLFLTSASKLRAVGPIIALIVGYALDLLGTSPGGEVAVRALLYAWLFVAIPAALSVAVNLLIAPAPRRLVERTLAERLDLTAAVLRGTNARTRAAFACSLDEGSGEMLAWLKLAGAEKTSPPADLAALRHGVDAAVAIQLLVALNADCPAAALPSALRKRVALVLEQMANILRAGAYPVEIDLPTGEHEAELAEVPTALLNDLREALLHFAVPQMSPPMLPAAKPAGGFFRPDALSNPEHVQYALKTTGAALFCYCLYVILDWPGIHTCFITCYIVSLSTTAEVVQKLTLRIFGCLLGAALGIAAIVYLIPSLTSIGALMAIVFLGAFAAAWVAAGSTRIAYAGLQIAFAFFLCVIQGSAPAFDMVTARDRVIGILIGNLVAYLVFVYIWPVSVARRIDPAIRSLVRGLSELVQSASLSHRRGIAGQTLSALSTIERDLGLLAYEPRSARPSNVWQAERSRMLGDLAALNAPLLLTADRDPQMSGEFARRLDQLAQTLAPASGVADKRSKKAAPHAGSANASLNPLWRLVNERLTALETAAAQVAAPRRIYGHAPA
jgi:multidrug resistance protein MdtO